MMIPGEVSRGGPVASLPLPTLCPLPPRRISAAHAQDRRRAGTALAGVAPLGALS